MLSYALPPWRNLVVSVLRSSAYGLRLGIHRSHLSLLLHTRCAFLSGLEGVDTLRQEGAVRFTQYWQESPSSAGQEVATQLGHRRGQERSYFIVTGRNNLVASILAGTTRGKSDRTFAGGQVRLMTL